MGDIGDFIAHVLWNWWTVLAGFIIAVEPVTRLVWPGYDAWAADWLPAVRRRRIARITALGAFIVANYLAFHDAKNQAREAQRTTGTVIARHLRPDEKTKLANALQLASGEKYWVEFNSPPNCDECEEYAQDFRDFFPTMPGWKADGGVITFAGSGGYREGLILIPNGNLYPELNKLLMTAFDTANIPLLRKPPEDFAKEIGAIIVVGRVPK